MEYHVLYITVLLLTQVPTQSAITSYNDIQQRTYRRHIDSTYVNYWENGLKESTFRTFLRKGYADPSLKDQIIHAPVLSLHRRQATPFGDVAVLARGQLYFAAGGFLFVQDENSYDCDECDESIQSRQNHGQIVALWTVRRLRHHDKAGYHRYETEYLISPTGNSDFLKKNGAFNYELPGYVFILRNSQLHNNFNYFQPTTAWHNAEDSGYFNTKPSRRYLPPDTTTATFYYTTPKNDYRYDQRYYHYQDPDIVPAKNNVEKEIELYNKLLQSLKSAQSTTSSVMPVSMAPTNKVPPSGYDRFNKITSNIPHSTGFMKMSTMSVHFPQTTPFKASPMYTRYSEPDPLYTTMPSASKRPYLLPEWMTTIKPVTGESTVSPKPTQISMLPVYIKINRTSTKSTPIASTFSTSVKPFPRITTSERTTPKIFATQTPPMPKEHITTLFGPPTTQKTSSASSTSNTFTSSIFSTSLKPISQNIIVTKTTPTRTTSSTSVLPQETPFKSSTLTRTPSTSTPVTLSTSIKPFPQTIATTNTIPRSTTSTFTTAQTITTEQQETINELPPVSYGIASLPSTLPAALNITQQTAITGAPLTTSEKVQNSTSPLLLMMNDFSSTKVYSPGSSTEFDIFDIFDKPKERERTSHLLHAEMNENETSERFKSQMLSPENLPETTPLYAESSQASSVILSVYKSTEASTMLSIGNATENDILKESLEYIAKADTPTVTAYVDVTTSYVLNKKEKDDESTSNEEISTESNEIITTPSGPEEITLEKVLTIANTVPYEVTLPQRETTKAFSVEDSISSPVLNKITGEESSRIHIVETVTPRMGIYEETTPEAPKRYFQEKTTSAKPFSLKQPVEKNLIQSTTETVTRYKAPSSFRKITTTPRTNTTPYTKKYKYTKIPKRKTTTNKRIGIRPSPTSFAVDKTNSKQFKIGTSYKINEFPKYDNKNQIVEDENTNKFAVTTETIMNTTGDEHQITTLPHTERTESTIYETTTLKMLTTNFHTPEVETTDDVIEDLTTSIPHSHEIPSQTIVQNKTTTESNPYDQDTTLAIPNERVSITTPNTNEVFDEIFGVFSKQTTSTTPAPVTKRTSNYVNQQLQEELFGFRNDDFENQSTQIEESTTEVERTPKIIFDNFYEPSTNSGDEGEYSSNIETTTLPLDIALLQETKVPDSDENTTSFTITSITIPFTQNTIENERSTTECIKKGINVDRAKELEITKIIMIQILNDTKSDKREIQANSSDTVEANVSKIDVGDENFIIYKAVIDEMEIPPEMKEEKEVDLFERLALSVVNHAKSIDYLNKRKQRIRRKKVFKQKTRRKEKQNPKK